MQIKSFLTAFLVFIFSSNASAVMKTRKGDWIGSGGAGISISPTLILLSPEVEYVYDTNIHFGILTQIGFGSDGVLFTGTGTGRLMLSPYGKIQPTIQGGMGLAMASTLFNQTFGVHLMVGFGADYEIDKSTSIGTMIRMNFAPPLKSFFISWPLIIGRFLL